MKHILNTLLAVYLFLVPSLLHAQAPDGRRAHLSLAAGADYKSYVTDGARSGRSAGFTSSVDLTTGRNIVVGLGFDGGAKSRAMDYYNFFLYARLGYAFRAGNWTFIPFVRAGWFYDLERENAGCERCRRETDSFLRSGGIEAGYRIIPGFDLFLSAQGMYSDFMANGAAVSAGVKVNFLR